MGDDACFSLDIVSWSECVSRDAPLLVQPIDSDDYFAAKLHRYSGVVEEFAAGVNRQPGYRQGNS